MPSVTIVICTYNRPQLLKKCLTSLAQQTVKQQRFEVVVVDNYGDESLTEILSGYDFHYVYEPTTGLSHARNRGAQEASTEWVFYLDDDGIAHPDMLASFFKAIANTAVNVIGGRYDHYFAEEPPKWLLRYYDTPVQAAYTEDLTLLSEQQYLSGGIMAAKKSVLLEHPFRTDLGMKGTQPGFGEENEWQDRLRHAGVPIHYYDKIAMDHLVQSHKQKLSNRIDLAYAHGKYHAQTTEKGNKGNPGFLLETLRVLLRSLPYDIGRVLFKPGFYWQNGLVSTLGKLAFLKGKYGR